MGPRGGLGVFGPFKGIDAFGKTMDDVRIRTNVGAFITLVSAFFIVLLTIGEFIDYRRVHMKNSLVVDVSRGEKLAVHIDIDFPRVPCYLLSLDIMDISGEHQNDITHDILRTRLDTHGKPIEEGKKGLTGEANEVAKVKGAGSGYCGDCYGGEPAEGSRCCNTCDEVRDAYVRKGWSFGNPDGIEQCVAEHWSEKIKEQNKEGCNIRGLVHVNKVVGNFHMSPGKAFQSNSMHVHDLVPYLAGTGAEHHDFGHVIKHFSFGSDAEYHMSKVRGSSKLESNGVKEKLKIKDPLEGLRAHTEESQFMFQYFVKVVGTEFTKLSGQQLKTYQYSVTSYERNLNPSAHAAAAAKAGVADDKAKEPHRTQHGFAGVPGVFFNYEISALKTVHRETRQSLAHFLTSTCAIVGGILTVAGLIDGAIYNGRRNFGKGKDNGAGRYGSHADGLGFAAANGKFL